MKVSPHYVESKIKEIKKRLLASEKDLDNGIVRYETQMMNQSNSSYERSIETNSQSSIAD